MYTGASVYCHSNDIVKENEIFFQIQLKNNYYVSIPNLSLFRCLIVHHYCCCLFINFIFNSQIRTFRHLMQITKSLYSTTAGTKRLRNFIHQANMVDNTVQRNINNCSIDKSSKLNANLATHF